MTRTLSWAPVGALFFAAGFWGIVWYPLRWLEARGLSGPWQLAVSYAAAFAVLSLVAWPGTAGLGRRPGAVLLMALAAGWTNLGFVLAMLEGSVARALILFYLSPLWTVLLGRFYLRERLERRTLASLLLGLGGVVSMLWRPEVEATDFSRSDLHALTAGMAFAVTNVLTRDLQQLGTRQKTLISWAGVVGLSAAVACLGSDASPPADWPVWVAAAALGVGGFLSATLAVIYGVSRMPVKRSAVILLAEIPVGALSAWWLAGEGLSLRELAGGGMILLAGVLAMGESQP